MIYVANIASIVEWLERITINPKIGGSTSPWRDLIKNQHLYL